MLQGKERKAELCSVDTEVIAFKLQFTMKFMRSMKPLTFMTSLESLKCINSINQRIDDVTDIDKFDGPAKITNIP